MKSAGFERFLILPQVQRFLGWIDAITGCAMQVEIDVDSMLSPKLYGIINILQIGLADLQQFLARIYARQSVPRSIIRSEKCY